MRKLGELIGVLEALDGETVWINKIHIDPRHRGRGHASALLTAVLAACDSVPVELAALPPTDGPGLGRTQLRDWYARHGFQHAPRPGDPDRMLRPARRVSATG
ncbi:GNAT family N-acetyltransferase [Kitasatospora sp. SolWspMP-SS2h]|uniref:GNAT family N-acetyltransferase n=1 Tax=Kitasatospora sp. SolWspMP-SS2h TaxID=1305729 RepID=UPI0011B94852|nr:GNAT family N-acetyltransferase [Kitasatospora sp. SolWspMP-SS2h]